MTLRDLCYLSKHFTICSVPAHQISKSKITALFVCVGSLAFQTRHTNKLSEKMPQIKAKGSGLSYLLKNLIHNH